MLLAVIWFMFSLVATGVVARVSSSTKPDSGVTRIAIVLIVTKDTNSCFGISTVTTHSVEPFLVTVELQGALRTNQ